MPNTYSGIYEALVHDLSDPQGQGRARLRIPSVLGQAMSAWARPALGRTSDQSVRVGDRVWVMFEHGELGRPVWFSPVQPLLDKIKPDVEQLHPNPSFDSVAPSTNGGFCNPGGVPSRYVPSGWNMDWCSGGPAAVASDSVVTRSGRGRSVRLDLPHGVGQTLLSDTFSVPPDAVVRLSAWVRAGDDTNADVAIGMFSAISGVVPNYFTADATLQSNSSFIPTTEWQKVSATFPVPTGHVNVRVALFAGGALGDASIWWDDTESSILGVGGGSGVEDITINFATPSSLWTLNHNLGKRYVDVRTMDSAGEKIVGDITFVDENTATVEWFFPTTGIAHITTG